MPTDEERFWAKVNKTATCWLWTATKLPAGYGQCRWNGGMRTAHRVSYEVAYGPIPTGLVLDHTCYDRACVNPLHLRAVTHKQNMENLTGARASNKSGARGVSWNKRLRKWEVTVRHNGRSFYGGIYLSVSDAAAAAVALRTKLFTHNDMDRKAS